MAHSVFFFFRKLLVYQWDYDAQLGLYQHS